MGIRVSSGSTNPSGKVFVLSLDGVSHAFLKRHCGEGHFPALRRLLAEGDFSPLETVRPPVSLVAWASYMTGVNPGMHGIYGFTDRQPGSFDLFVPNGGNIAQPSLWEVLSRAGRKVTVVNVPATYPPRPVNGILVAGMLSPSLEEATYPEETSRMLREMNYRLDADARLGKTDRDAFLADVDVTVRKRFEAAALLLKEREWDFFQLHVMETDRVNHLFWEDYERADSPYREAFLSFYRTLDDLVGEFLQRLPADCDIVLLSDHGFCLLKKLVYVNRFLEERDWLEFEHRKPRKLADMLPRSKAYSLMPGRIYLNMRGREPRGCVLGKDEYHGFREGIAADLLNLRDPEDDGEVVAEALRGEEVFSNPAWGDFPVAVSEKTPAPCDLLLLPRDGYDLKGNLDRPGVFGRGSVTGMHTASGAFVFLKGRRIEASRPHILDLYPTVLDMMGVETVDEIEGRSLLQPESEREGES